MKKIIVIGCPGSGKSYFSRKLGIKLKMPVYHLDNLYWNADQTHVSEEELREKLKEIFQKPRWIVDGNYLHTMEDRIKECDTIFFLNIPLHQCLENITNRLGTNRGDMPWTEQILDSDFIDYVSRYNDEQKPVIYEFMEKYREGREIFILDNRGEMDDFIGAIM